MNVAPLIIPYAMVFIVGLAIGLSVNIEWSRRLAKNDN